MMSFRSPVEKRCVNHPIMYRPKTLIERISVRQRTTGPLYESVFARMYYDIPETASFSRVVVQETVDDSCLIISRYSPSLGGST